MANKQTHLQKFHIIVTLDAGTGVKGETNGYKVYGETTLRVTPTGVGGTNVVDIEGRLEGETTWTSIGTVTGTTSDTLGYGFATNLVLVRFLDSHDPPRPGSL